MRRADERRGGEEAYARLEAIDGVDLDFAEFRAEGLLEAGLDQPHLRIVRRDDADGRGARVLRVRGEQQLDDVKRERRLEAVRTRFERATLREPS